MLTKSVVALASLAALVNSAPAPATVRRQTQCYSGVYMIVGRGTGEPAGESKPGAVADLVQAQIPNSASVAVVYPASSVDPPYPESVTDGINDTIQLVQDYVDTCGSSSNIVLIGFSQGANLMTDALAGGVDKPTPLSTDYTQYISAVTVFGDPTFTIGQSFDVGNATKSGIFSRGGSSLALLNTYADILQSYCMDHDPVCASGDDLAVHSAEVPTFENAAAAFIVAQQGN